MAMNAGLLSLIQDFLAFVWSEGFLLILAALVYIAFTGWFGKGKKKTCGSKAAVGKGTSTQKARCPEGWSKTPSKVKSETTGLSASPVLRPAGPERNVEGIAVKFTKTIKALGKEGNLQGAIEAFDKLKADNKSSVNSVAYNCLLDVCVECADMVVAGRYLQEANDCGMADVVSYNTVMKGCLAAGDIEAAERLFNEMTTSGLLASRVTYHSLLNAKVHAGDSRGAWCLIDQMEAAEMPPTMVTCSILLKALGPRSHSKEVERAMTLVDSVAKPMVDEVLLTSVVEACVRTGRLDMLSQQTRQYAQVGSLPVLSAPTYGSMIKAYGRAQDVQRVCELWEEMEKTNVKPTSVTVGCMIEALVMNRRTEEALRLVQRLWEDETQKELVNTVVYSTILKGFAMSKNTKQVMEAYNEMRARGIPCNTITYNTMLNAFAQCGTMDLVPQLMKDMKTSDPPAEPDIVTYSTIVKGYCVSGDLNKSLELLKEMKRETGLMPDEVLYNSLLDGCAKQHRLHEALSLLDEMDTAGVPPSNYTLSIMVKLLGRCKRLDRAFSLVETSCKKHGFRANIQVYTCLIQACFNNKQASRALALHDQIIKEGCWADEKTYTALARGCLQSGIPERAAEVIRCAHHLPGHCMAQMSGKPPGVDSRCLQDVLQNLGPNTEIAKSLLADLQACGPATKRASWNSARQPQQRQQW